MTALETGSLVVGAALLVYLVVALLKAEDF